MPTEPRGRIVANTTPFNTKDKNRSVSRGFGEQFGFQKLDLEGPRKQTMKMPTATNQMLPQKPKSNIMRDLAKAVITGKI
jgi:hypothetical protein